MSKGLLIIGAGGNGKVAADIALMMGHWDRIAFIDDRLVGQTVLGLPVVASTDKLAEQVSDYVDAFISIADPSIYANLKTRVVEVGFNLVQLIHPSSIIADSAQIGMGSMVSAGAIVNAQAVIGDDCIINTGAIVEHDCRIGARSHIAPAAALAGNVEVGQACWIGLGARINENLTLCDHCKIGSGAVVIQDITCAGTYVGVPVRSVKSEQP
jgi:sugar O-acyltransferase (sialic acid O-acetyltransferase NeuD family)